MPEGVTAYPRWDGPLREGSLVGVVAAQEVRRAIRNTWSLLALALGAAWGFASIAELYQNRRGGDEAHPIEGFVAMINQLRWFALAVAATVGGPGILEDARRGALDLYLSRSLTTLDYLFGKILAVVGLSTLTLFLPSVVYWAASFIFYSKHPAHWSLAILGALLYSLLWGLLVSGLALGLSCVSRSSRAATLLLFGGFALLEIIVSKLLKALTNNDKLDILSPFAALAQQTHWIFNVPLPFKFPYWWGLVEIAALTILGWALVAWRHPRVRGDERVRA